MAELNEANQANFTELDGHIKVLSAKLTQMTSGNTGVQSAIEDLEDYYERQLQMRIMHNTTLKEELREIQQKNKEMFHFLQAAPFRGLVGALFLHVFVPKRFFGFVFAHWTYAAVACVAVFCTRYFLQSRKRNRRRASLQACTT